MTTLRTLLVCTALTLTACTVDFGAGLFPASDEALELEPTVDTEPRSPRSPLDEEHLDDLCALDDDLDGIMNCDEELLGTSPTDADSDDDGLTDLEEMQAGTNPLSSDTDMDGLEDERELYFGLDPTKEDTLGDGIRDGERFIVRACDDAMPRAVNLHTSRRGDWALALPEAFSRYTTSSTTDQGQIQELATFDAPNEDVFGFVFSDPLDELGPVERLLTEITALKTLGALVQDLTEGAFDTHERFQAVSGEYVIETGMMSASTMRDDVLLALMDLEREDVAALPAPSARQHASFTVRLVVVEREDRFIIVGAIAPTSRLDDESTRILLSDATNTTTLANAQAVLVSKCFAFSFYDTLSSYRLSRLPVSSSVAMRTSDDGRTGRSMERSRTHGFDYFPQINSVVFFGDELPTSRRTKYAAASYFVFEERPRK